MENEVLLNEKVFKQIIDEKLKEAMDIRKLYEAKYPLSGPFEAYYFKAIRNFFESSIAHRIMEINQDIIPKEIIKQMSIGTR